MWRKNEKTQRTLIGKLLGLNMPMSCMIETFCGHYVACSLPPISTVSLCYGSNTSGIHITKNDSAILKLVDNVGSLLNIKKHVVTQLCDNQPIEISLPYNVQIHKYQISKAEKLYFVHMGCNFWARDKSGAYLRPEIMTNYRSNVVTPSLERFTWRRPTRCAECDKYIDDYEYYAYAKPAFGEQAASPFQYICCLSCYDELLPLRAFKVPIERLAKQSLPQSERLVHWRDNNTGEIHLSLFNRRLALNPDAFGRSSTPDPGGTDQSLLAAAFAKSRDDGVQELLRELNEAQDYMLIDSQHLARLAHAKGVGIRRLGLVVFKASCSYVRGIALTLVVSRGIKRIVQDALNKAKLTEDAREIIARYLNGVLTSTEGAHTEECWTKLTECVKEHWGIVVEKAMLSKVHLMGLAVATCQQLRVAVHKLFEVNLMLPSPFLKQNIVAVPSVLDESYVARSVDLLLVKAHNLIQTAAKAQANANIEREEQDKEEATKYYDRAARVAAAVYHRSSSKYADVILEYAQHLLTLRNPQLLTEHTQIAAHFFKEALGIYSKEEFAHKQVVECLLGLARARETRSAELLMRAGERAREVCGDEHVWTAQIYSSVALALAKNGSDQLAAPWIRKSFVACCKAVGEGHKALRTVYAHLQNIESAIKSPLSGVPIDLMESKIKQMQH